MIADGYTEAQGANPAIREHIHKLDMEQLTRQAYGILLSLMTCHMELTKEKLARVELGQLLAVFVDSLNKIGKNTGEMNKKLRERRTEFKRVIEEAEDKPWDTE